MTAPAPSRTTVPRMLIVALAMSAAVTTALMLALFAMDIVGLPAMLAIIAVEAGVAVFILRKARTASPRGRPADAGRADKRRSAGPIERTGR